MCDGSLQLLKASQYGIRLTSGYHCLSAGKELVWKLSFWDLRKFMRKKIESNQNFLEFVRKAELS
jgi:hypothetical protein